MFCIILDVSHSTEDLAVPESERADTILEEKTLVLETSTCSLHGLHTNTCVETDHGMLLPMRPCCNLKRAMIE